MSRLALLLIDEPFLGLSPVALDQILATVLAIYEAAGMLVLTERFATLWLLSAPTVNLLVKPEFIGRYRFAAQSRNNHVSIAASRVRDGEHDARALVAEFAEGSRMLGALMKEVDWDAGEKTQKRKRRRAN